MQRRCVVNSTEGRNLFPGKGVSESNIWYNCLMVNIPDFPEQTPLGFEHFEAVVEALHEQQVFSSDYAFYGVMGWYEVRPPLISKIGAKLLIDVEDDNDGHVFMGPFGTGDIRKPLEKLLSHFPEFGLSDRMTYVPQKIASEIIQNFAVKDVIPQREDFDYIYSRRDLATLAGRKFQAKRNFVNRINTSMAPEVNILETGNHDEIFSYLTSWYEHHGRDDIFLQLEKKTIWRMLPELHKMNGICVVVKIDGEISGLSIATPVTHNCWMISVEKADRQIKGLYQYINWATANHLPAHVDLINREADLGYEGLRESKLSYHPLQFEEKFTLVF